MCCVMPPASVETTDVSRIASSSDVLPWSTWPMIVTTGARGSRSSGVVVEHLGGLDLVGRVRDRDLALELGADQLDGVVGQRLRDADELAEAHHRLLDDGGRDAERRREILDRDAGRNRHGTRGSDGLLALVASDPRRRGRDRGPGCGYRDAGARRRVSITTRRRRPAAAPPRCGRERRGGSEPGVPGPGRGRAPPPSLTPGPSTRPPPAGLEPWAGAPERAGADPAGALAADAAAAEGRDEPTGAVGTGNAASAAAATAETLLRAGRLTAERARRGGLVDGVAGQLDAGLGQAPGHLGGLEPALAGDICYALLRHRTSDSTIGVLPARRPRMRLHRSSGMVTWRRSVRVSARPDARADDAALELVHRTRRARPGRRRAGCRRRPARAVRARARVRDGRSRRRCAPVLCAGSGGVPLPAPRARGGRECRSSASRAARCSGSACPSRGSRRSDRRPRRRPRRPRRRSRPPPRRTRSRS